MVTKRSLPGSFIHIKPFLNDILNLETVVRKYAFSAIFKGNFLQIGNFSEKSAWAKLKVLFSTNFRPKTKKIVRAVFEKKISQFFT